MTETQLISTCRLLLDAKKQGLLGDCTMPEDTNPRFSTKEKELRLTYFTLPMALNYQRDSYKLWQSALETYDDPDTKDVFSVSASSSMTINELRIKLTKHKLALQPNKHVSTWRTISETVHTTWGSLQDLFEDVSFDFLQLREAVQHSHKKGFPYISGPKIFNYWSAIIQEYGGVELSNKEHIDIAPDTHVIKCTIKLGLITEDEAPTISREEISRRWRLALEGNTIRPIDMHSALWFWSRGNFAFSPHATPSIPLSHRFCGH